MTCDGDHWEWDAGSEKNRRDFALMLEGVCPTCEVAAERTDDGFAACPCCSVQWRMEGSLLHARFDASAFFSEEAS